MININIEYIFYSEDNLNLSCNDHTHDCTEITYNFAGSGTIFYNDVSWDWTPNSIHIYQPGNYHKVKKTGIGTELCFGITGLDINKFPSCVLSANPKLIDLFSQLSKILNAATRMQKERIELLCAMICVELMEQNKDLMRETKSNGAVTIRNVIDLNLNNKISISNLATKMYMSKDYFRQVFKKEYGVSPVKYAIQIKMEQACSLLEETDYSIKDISLKCGYTDPDYFCKLFKKLKGVSPTFYRKAFLRVCDIKIVFFN